MRIYFVTLLFLISLWGYSEVWIYPGPDLSLQSQKYSVKVIQNDVEYESFVYQDENQFQSEKNNMTDWNHWTTFSFSDSITVEIKKLSGNVGFCKIYPLSDSIVPSVNGNSIRFKLGSPKKLWVKIQGEYEHPLFIFADEPETDIPDKNSADVVYWEPGVHQIGEHYSLKSNTTYYLAGGAFLKGSFLSEYNATGIKIKGRGIICGREIKHCPYSQCQFDKTGILFNGTNKNVNFIEGITVTDPGQYCIQSYNGVLHTNNIKCFGWWYETDGWIGGNGSTLNDAFFKVNDDVVKLYHTNMEIKNLVIYHQFNGSPFQLGWGSEKGTSCVVSDIDIVTDESNSIGNNHAFICTSNGNSNNKVNNISISDVRVDEDMALLFGFKSYGVYDNIRLTDITIQGKIKFPSYMYYGSFSNIILKNISVGGKCVEKKEDITGITLITPVKSEVNFLGCNNPEVYILSDELPQKVVEGEKVSLPFSIVDDAGKAKSLSLYENNVLKASFDSIPSEIVLQDLPPGVYNISLKVNTLSGIVISSNSYALTVLPQELIQHYKFDNNGTDQTGRYGAWLNNGNVFEPGAVGVAATFDGVDDRMQVWNKISANFTIMFWVKSDSDTKGKYPKNGILDTDKYDDFKRDFSIFRVNNDLCYFEDTAKIVSVSGLFDETWHHIALIRDISESKLKAYLDGDKIEEKNFSGGFFLNQSTMMIGASQNLQNYFKGALDELIVYNRVLSDNEIKLHKNNYLAVDYRKVKSHFLHYNPATKTLEVNCNSSVNRSYQMLQLYTLNGRLIQQNKLTEGTNTINLNSLNTGIYVCRLFSNGISDMHSKVIIY